MKLSYWGRPGPSFQGWWGQAWRPWCPSPKRFHLGTNTQRPTGWEGPQAEPRPLAAHARSRAWAEVTCMRDTDSPGPHVCSHHAPPAQAQRQAPQAGLGVRPAAPAHLGQHSERTALTGLQTQVLTLGPEAPAPRPASPPTLEILWGGTRSGGPQMPQLSAARAGRPRRKAAVLERGPGARTLAST